MNHGPDKHTALHWVLNHWNKSRKFRNYHRDFHDYYNYELSLSAAWLGAQIFVNPYNPITCFNIITPFCDPKPWAWVHTLTSHHAHSDHSLIVRCPWGEILEIPLLYKDVSCHPQVFHILSEAVRRKGELPNGA